MGQAGSCSWTALLMAKCVPFKSLNQIPRSESEATTKKATKDIPQGEQQPAADSYLEKGTEVRKIQNEKPKPSGKTIRRDTEREVLLYARHQGAARDGRRAPAAKKEAGASGGHSPAPVPCHWPPCPERPRELPGCPCWALR